MFNDYIKRLIPCHVENIEQSENNSYLYRITMSVHLLNEYREIIEKIFKKNSKIKTFEGWFNYSNSFYYGYKFALVEFKRVETRHN